MEELSEQRLSGDEDAASDDEGYESDQFSGDDDGSDSDDYGSAGEDSDLDNIDDDYQEDQDGDFIATIDNLEGPVEASDSEDEEQAAARHANPGQQLVKPDQSSGSAKGRKEALEELLGNFKQLRERQVDLATGEDKDNPKQERCSEFSTAPGLGAVLWKVAAKLLAEWSEECVKEKCSNPGYFYTVFMRAKATNENIINMIKEIDSGFIINDTLGEEILQGLDKNVRGHAQEIQAVWWFKLLRSVWHLNECQKREEARSYRLLHVFLSNVPQDTGYALPPKGPERDEMKLPEIIQAHLDKDTGIDGIAIYEDDNEQRLYVLMQSKSSIEAPWSKPEWAKPAKFLLAGQAVLRQLRDEGAECVLLWYCNFMEAPAEFTQVSTNYKDLHEDDCMAYTTLDQLDSDFDAGEFMPRIKSALVKVASENAAAMDIEEHHRKTPRGFQLGLIKRIRLKEKERRSKGLLTANMTSSQPCGTGKTLAGYFVAVDKEIFKTVEMPSLVATCRLRLVLQFMTAWIEQERAQAQFEYSQRAAGNSDARRRQIYYFAVCSKMTVSNGIRILSGDVQIVKQLCNAVETTVAEIKAKVAAEERSVFRFFTTYQSGVLFRRCVKLASIRLVKEKIIEPDTPLFGLFARDEAHMATGPAWDGFCAILAVPARLGLSLTATPRFWQKRKLPATIMPENIDESCFDLGQEDLDSIKEIEDVQGFVASGAEDAGNETDVTMEIDSAGGEGGNGVAGNTSHVPSLLDPLVKAASTVYYPTSQIWKNGSRACEVARVVAKAFDHRPKGGKEVKQPVQTRQELELRVKSAARSLWSRLKTSKSENGPLIAFRVQKSGDVYTTYQDDDTREPDWFAVHPDDKLVDKTTPIYLPELSTKEKVLEVMDDPRTVCIGFMPTVDEKKNTRFDLFLAECKSYGSSRTERANIPLVHDMSGQDPRCPHGKIEHAVSIARAAAEGAIGRFNFYLMEVPVGILNLMGGDEPNKKAVKIKFDHGIVEGVLPEAAVSDLKAMKITGQEFMAAAYAYNLFINDITPANDAPGGIPRRENRKILGFCNSVKAAMVQANIVRLLMEHLAPKELAADDPNEFFCGVAFSSTVADKEGGTLNMSMEDQERELSMFKHARRGILFNYRLIDIGYDFPGINSVLFADATSSAERLLQAVGRGARSKGPQGYDVFFACSPDPSSEERAKKVLARLSESLDDTSENNDIEGEEEEDSEEEVIVLISDEEEEDEGKAPPPKRRRKEKAFLHDRFQVMREILAKAFVDQLLVLGQLFAVAGAEHGALAGDGKGIGKAGIMTLGEKSVEMVELDVSTTADLVKAISAVAATLRQPWIGMYNALKKWKRGKEDRWPSGKSESPTEKSLGSWMAGQLNAYQKGKLPNDIYEAELTCSKKCELLLELPGWKTKARGPYGWAANLPPARRFMESYKDFCTWRTHFTGKWPKESKNGRGNQNEGDGAGSSEVREDDKKRAGWFRNQMFRYKKGLLKDGVGQHGVTKAEKIKYLEEIDGWIEKAGGSYGWAKDLPPPKTWREIFEQVVKCITTTGEFPSDNFKNKEGDEDAAKLVKWFKKQVKEYKTGVLGDERRKDGSTSKEEKQCLLEGLPAWNELVGGNYGHAANQQKNWEGSYSLAFEWKIGKHPDIWPEKTKELLQLHDWLRGQKGAYRYGNLKDDPINGNLTAEIKRTKLNELPGWRKWVGGDYGWLSTEEVSWAEMFDELVSWRTENSEIWPRKISDTKDDDVLRREMRLFTWLFKQIKLYKNGELGDESDVMFADGSRKPGTTAQDKRTKLEGLKSWREKSKSNYGSSSDKKPAKSWLQSYNDCNEWMAEHPENPWPQKHDGACETELRLANWLEKQAKIYCKLSPRNRANLKKFERWDEFAKQFEGEAEKEPNKTWQQRYDELKQWLKDNKNVYPRSGNAKGSTEVERRLRDWFLGQVRDYKKGALSEELIGNECLAAEGKCHLFEQLPGFGDQAGGPYGHEKNKTKEAKVPTRTWRLTYDELLAWKRELGRKDDDWPSKNRPKDKIEQSIATWVNNQVTRYCKGTIGVIKSENITVEEKCRLLEELPGWKKKAGTHFGCNSGKTPETWKQKYERLLQWKQSNGEDEWPPQSEELGIWVATQRGEYNKGELKDEKLHGGTSAEDKRKLLEALPGWAKKSGGIYGHAKASTS